MNKPNHGPRKRRLLKHSVILISSVFSTASFAASVCTNSQGNLVFNDSNITANGNVWVAGYNNGSWMWSADSSCTAGQCVSVYSYNGGQVEFRVEGPGVQDYYSPGPSNAMHTPVTPSSCNGGSTPAPTMTATPVSTLNPTSTPTSTPSSTLPPTVGGSTTTIEAESGSVYGRAQTYTDSVASSGAGVAYISAVGSGFSLTNVPAANKISLRYASINSGSISLRVNGSDVGNLNFSASGSWTANYTTASVNVAIPQNATLDIFYENGDAALNVDNIEFSSSNSTTRTQTPTPAPTQTTVTTTSSKPTIPSNGQQYFFIGQDRQSIVDYMNTSGLPKPYGMTMYATLSRGEPSFDRSYCFKGLDGLKHVNNYYSNRTAACGNDNHRQNHWGSGEQNVQWLIETYNPEVVAIGLWCPSNNNMPALYHDKAYDDLLTELADFFKTYNSTKFLLRTCYEFNGDAGGWSPENFRKTFKYVRTFLDGQNVKNVAHVWQSDSYHGTGRTQSAIGNREEGYWPGKQYVDWVGASQFDSDVGEEANIAVAEGLPLFIAEATPHGALGHQYDFKLPFNGTGSSPNGRVTLHNDLNWFNAKDDEIYYDVSKAWSYINADWSSQPQWSNAADQAGENYFKYSDTRIQINPTVENHFKNMVTRSNGFILGQ